MFRVISIIIVFFLLHVSAVEGANKVNVGKNFIWVEYSYNSQLIKDVSLDSLPNFKSYLNLNPSENESYRNGFFKKVMGGLSFFIGMIASTYGMYDYVINDNVNKYVVAPALTFTIPIPMSLHWWGNEQISGTVERYNSWVVNDK
jgi:hypothetical protein